MKVNDKKELHAKEADELRKMLRDGHELLLSLQLDLQQNKLKNTRGIYNTRKNIAVIKTILRGKEEQKAEVKEEKPAAAVEAAPAKAEKAETKPAAKKKTEK